MNRRFLIGTGYWNARNAKDPPDLFPEIWRENTAKAIRSKPEYPRRVPIMIDNAREPHPQYELYLGGIIILDGNLGHINDLVVTKTKKHDYCGWSGSMLALALIAYCDEADFIYKEQDCLAFGPWIDRMYDELGDGKVIHGSCQIQPAAQSLFLVKHDYIPEFVRGYLAEGPDNNEHNLPEMKFDRLGKKHGWKRFSFGYDRDRPFNVADEVFYVQQVTPEELSLLRDAKLI